MKRKNTFAKIIFFATSLLIYSCSSFLDEENIAGQSAEEYFATAVGYESLINGCYNTMKSVYNTKNYNVLSQLGTDIVTQNAVNAPTLAAVNKYTLYHSDNGFVYLQWTNLYAALKNVNAAIDRAQNVITKAKDPRDGMDESLLAQRVAEAKFLRALYLFDIVRNWGQAPLILHEPTEVSNVSQRDSEDMFYEQILADLHDVLNSTLPVKRTASEYGRVSKAAAKHLRSLVYLTRGYQDYGNESDFTNALADAEDVILNSGHKLLEDYALVHRQTNEENDEIIFCINFANKDKYWGNIYPEFYMPVYREGWVDLAPSNLYGSDAAAHTIMPTKYTYLLFDWKKDQRTRVTFMSPYNGDASTSIDGRTAGNNYFVSINGSIVPTGEPVIYFPVPLDGGFNNYVYTQEEKNIAKEKGQYYFNYPLGTLEERSYKDASNDDYYITGYQGGDAGSRTWLPIWKFKDANMQHGGTGGEVGQVGRDIFLFRLAETYLIATEAAVNTNENNKALTYINTIRERASNNAPESGLTLYSGTITIDDVLDERALELFGEVPRWNDLTRTGKLAERALEYNWDISNIDGANRTELSASTNAKFSLRPIPVAWLNSLSNGQELGNNPGW
ncbi:MAG: RagB/SusD family nutrient uptake outer membrane protein [Paludibacter sp.]|nr:RagB/SusD family nutrient uptake outer membrane protein [Paludibacter sp.]